MGGYGLAGYGIGLSFGYDNRGCLVVPVYPAQNAGGVETDDKITITIANEDRVKASTILIEVDRGAGFEAAFRYADTAERFKSGWDGPTSQWSVEGGVYTIVIDPTEDFSAGTLISVRVTAEDPAADPERLP